MTLFLRSAQAFDKYHGEGSDAALTTTRTETTSSRLGARGLVLDRVTISVIEMRSSRMALRGNGNV